MRANIRASRSHACSSKPTIVDLAGQRYSRKCPQNLVHADIAVELRGYVAAIAVFSSILYASPI